MRYFDLNIPWPVTVPVSAQGSSSGQAGKKGKQQQLETPDQTGLSLLDDSGQQTVEEILRMLFHCKCFALFAALPLT